MESKSFKDKVVSDFCFDALQTMPCALWQIFEEISPQIWNTFIQGKIDIILEHCSKQSGHDHQFSNFIVFWWRGEKFQFEKSFRMAHQPLWYMGQYLLTYVTLQNLKFYYTTSLIKVSSYVLGVKLCILVTLRLQGSMWQDKAEPCTMHHQARQIQAGNIRTHFSVSSPPQCTAVLALSICVHQHTQDVPVKQVLPSFALKSSIKIDHQI